MEVEIELVFGRLLTVLVGGLEVEVQGGVLQGEVLDRQPGRDQVLLCLQRMSHELIILLSHPELEVTQLPGQLGGLRGGPREETDLILIF